MSQVPTITVQFKPFTLELTRWQDGRWSADLRRLTDEAGAPPLVRASSDPHRRETDARVSLEDATPRLRVGGAAFHVPKKQLLRLRDWIEQQNRMVLEARTADDICREFGVPAGDGTTTPPPGGAS